jgi:flagellar FliJ protein
MAFRFNLESVLKHRHRLEEMAQREFAEAQQALNEILLKIEGMYRRLDEAREEIAAAERVGGPRQIEEIRALEQFMGGFRRRIDETRLRARELMAATEEKQEALIAAAREKKILIKLRERRLHEYRERLGRIEAKELDDMTMIRQARGKRR